MTFTDGFGDYVGRVVDDVLRNERLKVLLPAFIGIFLVGKLYRQALPLYFEAAGLSLAFLGLAKGVANAFEIVVSPIAGMLADTVDRMRIAAIASIATGVLLATFVLRPGTIAVGALITLIAIALLFLNNSITPAVNAALEDGVEGIGWGVRDVGMYAGSAAGLAVAGMILSRTERIELVFLLAVPLLFAIGAVAWMRGRGSGGSIRAELATLELGSILSFGLREQLRSVSNQRLLLTFCLVELATTAGMGMTMFLLPVLATDLGFAAAGYLFVYSGSLLFGASASIVGGIAADHLPRKWLFVANFVVEGAMLVAFAFAGGPTLFLVGMGLFVAQTTFEPGVIAYFFENFDDEEGGTIWGIKGSVHKIANVVAPVVGGGLFAVNPQLTFLVGGVLMVIGAAIATRLPR